MRAKKKFSKAQTKKMIPVLREFNSMAKVFLKLINGKINKKEKRISQIAVLVQGMAIPHKHHDIDIQTIDIRKTTIQKKGSYSFNKTMDWEQDLKSIRKKGLIL